MLKNTQRTIADASFLEHAGVATATVTSGDHTGHTITFKTRKHQCGAYSESIDCSCEGHWHNAMNGCWQQGHQRDEHGPQELSAFVGLFYQALQ